MGFFFFFFVIVISTFFIYFFQNVLQSLLHHIITMILTRHLLSFFLVLRVGTADECVPQYSPYPISCIDCR